MRQGAQQGGAWVCSLPWLFKPRNLLIYIQLKWSLSGFVFYVHLPLSLSHVTFRTYRTDAPKVRSAARPDALVAMPMDWHPTTGRTRRRRPNQTFCTIFFCTSWTFKLTHPTARSAQWSSLCMRTSDIVGSAPSPHCTEQQERCSLTAKSASLSRHVGTLCHATHTLLLVSGNDAS